MTLPDRDFERWMQDAEFAGAYTVASQRLDELGQCQCRICECYEIAESDGGLCLGCQHGAHPGEVE